MSRRHALSADDELADLQKKYAALEGDRKAYIETSQWTIKQNRETIQAIKNENKALRAQLQSIHDQRHAARGQRAGAGGGPVAAAERAMSAGLRDSLRTEWRRLGEYVGDLRKRHDELHQTSLRKASQMKKQIGETRALEMDAAPITEGASPAAAQHMRALENRLEKALVKHAEAASIRQTYEQIVMRLRHERTSFDNQLAAIGRTLKAKEHDLEELIMMAHDANHAKETAKSELARVDAQLLQERIQRDKELSERRAQARARQEQASKAEMKMKIVEISSDGRTDSRGPTPSRIGAEADQSQRPASREGGGTEEEQEKRATTFDEAFKRIKEATGVSSANDVIQKFSTQEETAHNLRQLTREVQARIDILVQENNAIKAMIEDVKYSSVNTLGSRRVVDEYEVKLAEANANCERLRQRYERIAHVLINLKAGAEHLQEKLEMVRIDQTPVVLTFETMVDVFQQCEAKLAKTLDSFKNDQEILHLVEDADSMGIFAHHEHQYAELHLPNNFRIGVRNDLVASLVEEEEEGYYTETTDSKEVPDRLFVKTASAQMMERAIKKAKRKNNRFGGITRSEPVTPQPSGSSLPGRRPRDVLSAHALKGRASHGKKAELE